MEKTKNTTPKSSQKMIEPNSSGKKLVQARLPFKILPSSPFESCEKMAPPSVSSPTRKRKLSYSDHEDTERKENTDAIIGSEIILLDDSDVEEPKTPVTKATRSSSSGSSCKLKIKLPSSKKKRKSKGALESQKSETLEGNPLKKVKIDDTADVVIEDGEIDQVVVAPEIEEKLDASKKLNLEVDPEIDASNVDDPKEPKSKTPKIRAKSTPKANKLSSKKDNKQKAKLNTVEDCKNADTPKTKKGKKSSPLKDGEESKKEEDKSDPISDKSVSESEKEDSVQEVTSDSGISAENEKEEKPEGNLNTKEDNHSSMEVDEVIEIENDNLESSKKVRFLFKIDFVSCFG